MTRDAANGVEVAWKTISNHLEKVARLYKQGAGTERIGQYLKGWWKWVRSGVELLGGAGLVIEWYFEKVLDQLSCVQQPINSY